MDDNPILKFIDHSTSILRVGTDCSGIEAPIQALRQLGIPFKHVFSSEIDKYCIKSIKANYYPEIIFGDPDGPFKDGDITKRKIEDVPDIDLYVCGFPCQPFSQAGKKKGFDDKRGNVFWSCLEVIERKQPKYFILENVLGLLSHDKKNKKDKYGNTWNTIWSSLSELEKYGYVVKWKVLNTRDYGIPQNRRRVFMVGCKGKDFDWPNPIKIENINNYINYSNVKIDNMNNICKKVINKIKNNTLIINYMYNYNNYPNGEKYIPCITASTNTFWCIPLHRHLNTYELLNFQGFSINFIQTVSDTQIKKQIGNSISVNVLKYIIKYSLY
jgi:DNA (cytosine-5)-methyltransferase 1